MNIAIVTRYKNFPAGDFPGGDETIHRQIALIFEELGHHVDIIGLDTVIESGKISFHEKIFSQRIFLLGPCVIGRFFKTIQDRYDIVLANGEYGAFINHSRTFVLYHFSSLGYTKQLFSLKYFWKKKFSLRLISQMIYFSRRKKLEKIASYGHRTIAVSDYVKTWLEKQGVTIDRVIYNCIDLNRFKPQENGQKKDFLFVGRYDYFGKGFDILEKLSSAGLSIDCYTNHRAGNFGGLNYCGLIIQDRMPFIYSRYKILLFPSRYESFGIVPIEAMACGIPAVMSNVGFGDLLKKEIPEFIVDGWDYNAVEKYLARVKIILNDYSSYSLRARAFVEKNFHPDIFRGKWVDLLK